MASSGDNKDKEEAKDSDEEEAITLGPRRSLREQLEKDKGDKSLRKWKEQLLGSVDINNIGETLDPEVKFLSVSIVSADRPDMVLPIPGDGKPPGLWFTLKEGSHYRLKLSFQVSNNIVSGLSYTNTVWKTGVKVYSTKDMIGTFSPQLEPYTHEMPEETTPSGFFGKRIIYCNIFIICYGIRFRANTYLFNNIGGLEVSAASEDGPSQMVPTFLFSTCVLPSTRFLGI
ncbi:hypothetical protein HRI_002633000 [Hibiscus trionum]|uniref:Rho GDP-dissociation inhibitor 1 n=1 Tax=Hibiscus trionum TaxID=183268 RepID=A0A9W7I5V8_HIBTR|nr:hypothetical protein HRI_002633000 [Hibiscus trionum]